MDTQYIKVRGAKQHNLKNIDLDIPKNKMVVFSGVSGSGKSSLAFDTIYAEGQRRYVESLSTYARQFLGIMEKPNVDHIDGLSPAISIDQKTTSRNPRSTVGTVTEVYDYLRLLFARIGHPHCPICGREISRQSLDQIVSSCFSLITDTLKTENQMRFLVLSSIVRDKKGEFTSLLDNLKAKGINKVRIDNYIKDVSDDLYLIKTNKHSIDAQIDKISVNRKDIKDEITKSNLKKRLSDSLDKALKLSEGLVIISEIKDKSLEIPEFPKNFKDHLFSEKFACPQDNIQIAEIEPRIFSFNSPHGACEVCTGIGKILKIEPNFIFSKELSIKEGGIIPFSNIFDYDTWFSRILLTVCLENDINPQLPIKMLTPDQIDILLYGTKDRVYKVEGTNRQGNITHIYEVFPGLIAELEKRHKNSQSDWVKSEIEKYMRQIMCSKCLGTRLKPESLSVTIDKKSIAEVTSYNITNLLKFFKDLQSGDIFLNEKEKEISVLILDEIIKRLEFLNSVGLEYLTLDREAGSLSGGEAQRIRLASQIGSGLSGVLYVLDEPTIGLHIRDNERLIATLKKLKDLGNTVIVVEHDEEMIRKSDHIIDFGPGAGKYGGNVIFSGSPKDILKDKNSLTGQYLSGSQKIKSQLRLFDNSDSDEYIKITGCKQYNLKNIDVSIPLGKFAVITGVSGSGKSSLLVDTLYPAIQNQLNKQFKGQSGVYKHLEGIEKINKVILIDQSPIGRTPRSNPATYTKLFDPIRDVFARTKDAKLLGYGKGRFSFNVKGGRCEACEGQGQIKIEMQFMSDIWITCEVCNGKRYSSQTLEVTYKNKNIAEVLSMNISEAKDFFHNNFAIESKLETLEAVGLSYMELGQPATTLSGGEAQRVKLSTELSKRESGRSLYILDEPTTGLHFYDVQKLLNVLRLLVQKGNTVLVIEHNMDIIKNSDWIIDLGPEGGDMGGEVLYQGPLKNIRNVKNSYTAKYLLNNV